MTHLNEDAARFHNRLRILMGIDEHEFVSAGAFVDPRTNLVDYATAAAIWTIVERREAKRKD